MGNSNGRKNLGWWTVFHLGRAAAQPHWTVERGREPGCHFRSWGKQRGLWPRSASRRKDSGRWILFHIGWPVALAHRSAQQHRLGDGESGLGRHEHHVAAGRHRPRGVTDHIRSFYQRCELVRFGNWDTNWRWLAVMWSKLAWYGECERPGFPCRRLGQRLKLVRGDAGRRIGNERSVHREPSAEPHEYFRHHRHIRSRSRWHPALELPVAQEWHLAA